MSTRPGPTRSSMAAEPELPELRLTDSTWPNVTQLAPENTPEADKSMPASPNSKGPAVSPPGATRSDSVPFPDGNTLASAKPDALRFAATPQHGALLLPISQEPEVTHFRAVSVGTAAPPSKS